MFKETRKSSTEKPKHTLKQSHIFSSKTLPVRKGINSARVLSTPNASAIVDNFFILFRRS